MRYDITSNRAVKVTRTPCRALDNRKHDCVRGRATVFNKSWYTSPYVQEQYLHVRRRFLRGLLRETRSVGTNVGELHSGCYVENVLLSRKGLPAASVTHYVSLDNVYFL